MAQNVTMTGRTMLGFVIAPFGGVLTFFILGLFFGSSGTTLSTDLASWRLAYGLVVVLLVAYLAEACVAAPLHRELERRGAATGAAPFAAYGLVEVLARLRSRAGPIQGIDLRFAAG